MKKLIIAIILIPVVSCNNNRTNANSDEKDTTYMGSPPGSTGNNESRMNNDTTHFNDSTIRDSTK